MKSNNILRYEDLTPEWKAEEDAYRQVAKKHTNEWKDLLAFLCLQLGIFWILWFSLKLLPRITKRKARFFKSLNINILGCFAAAALYQVFWLQQINLWTALLGLVIVNLILIYMFLLKGKR